MLRPARWAQDRMHDLLQLRHATNRGGRFSREKKYRSFNTPTLAVLPRGRYRGRIIAPRQSTRITRSGGRKGPSFADFTAAHVVLLKAHRHRCSLSFLRISLSETCGPSVLADLSRISIRQPRLGPPHDTSFLSRSSNIYRWCNLLKK